MTRKQTLRIGVYGCLGLIVLLLLLHPFTRQTLFGPKVQDMPLCYWQDNFRRYAERGTPRDSLATKLLRWLGFDQSNQPWGLPNRSEDMLIVLLSLVDDSDPKVREMVAMSLWRRFGPNWEHDLDVCVPPLLRLLNDREATVRTAAAFGLAEIKPEPAAALPRLLQMLDDPDPTCRIQAAWGLWYVGQKKHPEVVGVLRQALKDTNYLNRITALGYLLRLDTDISEASAEILACATSDSNPMVRLNAANTLGKIGPAAVPVLRGMLRDSHWACRENAARALGRIGPAARDALPDLQGLLNDSTNNVRDSAADALHRIDPEQFAAPNRDPE